MFVLKKINESLYWSELQNKLVVDIKLAKKYNSYDEASADTPRVMAIVDIERLSFNFLLPYEVI